MPTPRIPPDPAPHHQPRIWRLHHRIRPCEPRNRHRQPHPRLNPKPAPAASRAASHQRRTPQRPWKTAATATARHARAGHASEPALSPQAAAPKLDPDTIHVSGQATAGSSHADQNACAPMPYSHHAVADQRQRTSPPPSSRAARAFPSVVFGSDQGREGG